LNSNEQIHSVKSPEDFNIQKGFINILDLHNLDRNSLAVGQLSSACGKASMEYIDKAAEMVIQGKAKAIVTTPINKKATKLAGYGEFGHLEYLACLTNAPEYATMLVSGPLRVVHLTTHYSLLEACHLVKRDRILGKVKLIHDSFINWGFQKAHIAVAALNPHGGEDGLFGREEIDEISPAIEDARAIGINVHGPFPADSAFNRVISGEFDVILALYHDQGHIPIKVYGIEKSVSIALGLPFVRTSVDHGTAFDIAGKGIADARSLVEAIIVAVNMIMKKGIA
jgi:4-hydroxythreonine-4-phosphate dehydrogenase